MKGNVKVEHEDGREEVMHYSEAVRRGYLTEEA
jgi:hypothetical protein